MPITPEQARKLTREEEIRLNQIQSEIDDAIRDSFQSNIEIVQYEIHMSDRLLNRIHAAYRAAGWITKVECTPKNEVVLILKPKS